MQAARCRIHVAPALLVVLLLAWRTATVFPGEQPAMFSEGEAYERFMGRWSRQLAPRLVQFAGVRDREAILDIGSGTGALAEAVAAVAPTSRITGIDPSPAYVAFARDKTRAPRVQFEVGDAQQLTLPDATMDRTLSLLVLNFIPDPRRAVREMVRVTRPGGTVAAAVWDYGDGMQMLRVFWDEAVALEPATEPRDERHMPLCRSGELASLWRQHGLTDVVEDGLTIETRFASFEDYWQPFLAGQGPAGAYVARLAPETRTKLRDRLERRVLGGRPDGPIVLTARAWAVRGRVPAPARSDR